MKKQIVLCNCQSKTNDQTKLDFIKTHLHQKNLPFIEITDFCGVCVTKKTELKDLLPKNSSNLFIACFERTVKELINFADLKNSDLTWTFLNYRTLSGQQMIDTAMDFFADEDQNPCKKDLAGDPDWPSWYPVIDYDRCSNCGQCVEFCLFGVYQKSETGPKVVKPQNCKNNCPACARICPQTAIIFPKLEEGGAISGADPNSENNQLNKNSQQVKDFIKGNIHDILRERQKLKKSILKKEVRERALKERQEAQKEEKQNETP